MKLGNKVIIRGVFLLRTTEKDKAKRRRTKALRLKTNQFGEGRTEGIES